MNTCILMCECKLMCVPIYLFVPMQYKELAVIPQLDVSTLLLGLQVHATMTDLKK